MVECTLLVVARDFDRGAMALAWRSGLDDNRVGFGQHTRGTRGWGERVAVG